MFSVICHCTAAVAQSCPVDTTSSLDISWSETSPFVYDVQRCCKLLNETVGEECSGHVLYDVDCPSDAQPIWIQLHFGAIA